MEIRGDFQLQFAIERRDQHQAVSERVVARGPLNQIAFL